MPNFVRYYDRINHRRGIVRRDLIREFSVERNGDGVLRIDRSGGRVDTIFTDADGAADIVRQLAALPEATALQRA